MLIVGFLKFLKRDKKGSSDELDVPPELPLKQSGFGNKMPEFPDLPDFDKDLPELGMEMPNFDFSEGDADISGANNDYGKSPEFPQLPDIEEESIQQIPPISAPEMQQLSEQEPEKEQEPEIAEQKEEQESAAEEEHPAVALLPPYQKPMGRLFSHRMQREMPAGTSIYVKVDNFKAMLGTVNLVRSDLRKSEGSLMKLETIKNSKDKSFDKIKSSLDDLQKKLIFIDKTLFKGE